MLYGKTRRGEDGEIVACHGLIDHLADVAAMFETLLSLPTFAGRLAAFHHVEENKWLVARLCVFAGLHDLGKFSPTVQRRMLDNDLSLPGHIAVCRAFADEAFAKRLFGVLTPVWQWPNGNPDMECQLFMAALSHHGSPFEFPEAHKAEEATRWWNTEGGLDPLAAIQDLVEQLECWFPEAFAKEAPRLPDSAELVHFFAGLLMLADWLASDTELFPFCGENGRPSDGDPMDYARQAAAQAVQRVQLDVHTWRDGTPLPSFETLFPFSPNSMQKAMDTVPLDSGGTLTILEGETGSGKTEAALRHFARLFWSGHVDSLYFANPLRLAATQIHSRVSRFISKAFHPHPPPTVLAIPGYLKVDDVTGYRLPDFKVNWPRDNDPKRFWASEQPKRFLASPVAVGTIDQALLAGLRVRHAHLRAAALSRSLLIIDEVHSSDEYMTELTLNLVRWLKLCDGHVLLMSATLGGATRQRYIDEALGKPLRKRRKLALAECIQTPYPLVSWKGGHLTPEHDKKPGKDIRVEFVEDMRKPEAVASLAAKFAEQGACVLVLRNSVDRAVETARELEIRLRDRPELLFSVRGVATLHHGRFAREDRLLLDAEAVGRFGKEAAEKGNRWPCVIVSTQTMEQSLDVDFDILITDLCPMDVLLQRIGRLHRHGNARTTEFASPRCIVLVPEVPVAEWLLGKKSNAREYGFGEDRAYENIVSVEATRRLLEEHARQDFSLRIPAQNRELVEKATHPEELERLAQELGADWERNWQNIVGKSGAQCGGARLNSIEWSQPFGPESAGASNVESRITTRLGLDDALVEFRTPVVSPFGENLTALRVPGWMLGNIQCDASPEIKSTTTDGMTFTLNSRLFAYDRLGLRQIKESA